MGNLLSAAAPVRQQGATTVVYVEEDFTATPTTGNLTTNNLAVDELGGGWVASASDFAYSADGSGVTCASTSPNRLTKIQTDGREDVRVTCAWVSNRNGGSALWQGFCFRSGSSTDRTDTLFVRLNGNNADCNLELKDATTTLKTWDLSVLLGAAVADDDHLVVVIDCLGDDITLVSIDVNGAGPTAVNDTYTLSGSAATDHGAGSGADHYGLYTNQKSASSSERFEYFKVESIPA